MTDARKALADAEARLATLEAPMHAVHAAQSALGFAREKRDRGFGGTDAEVKAAEDALASAKQARKDADIDQQAIDQASQAVINARAAVEAEGKA